jgi:hypothetical protein
VALHSTAHITRMLAMPVARELTFAPALKCPSISFGHCKQVCLFYFELRFSALLPTAIFSLRLL